MAPAGRGNAPRTDARFWVRVRPRRITPRRRVFLVEGLERRFNSGYLSVPTPRQDGDPVRNGGARPGASHHEPVGLIVSTLRPVPTTITSTVVIWSRSALVAASSSVVRPGTARHVATCCVAPLRVRTIKA